VQLVGMASTRTGLRSADSSNYSLTRQNTRAGERAFSYAGPAAWNQLHKSIRQLQTTSFKHKHSRHFFLHSVISLQTDCVHWLFHYWF